MAGLTPREQEICAALAPELKRRGLLFVGIDVIGGQWLTEINVTSPTGIVAIDTFNGTDTSAMIWDAIERRVSARLRATQACSMTELSLRIFPAGGPWGIEIGRATV